MGSTYVYLAYAAPLAIFWIAYAHVRRKSSQRAETAYKSSVSDGLNEPASLHPSIDLSLCLGCGACVQACPEGKVIGLVDGKARLINGADCIGHGACKAACPFDAITLVFGTEQRGVDIPQVGSDFQTNIPGIFIAGELGGMGLIRNAIDQGKKALAGIIPIARQRTHDICDVIIVGAGPAGLAAGLAAKSAGLRFVILEQESFGGTVAHFPRAKIVMTQPIDLPLVGKMRFNEVAKERLLALWQDVLQRYPLPIRYGEHVERIAAGRNEYCVYTGTSMFRSATILLAIGRRGTPRKLDVPGEEQSKVVYRLSDPAQYRGMRVLVVGGGDSALEAAAEIAEQPNTHVTLSYRGDAFSRAKAKNRKRIEKSRVAIQLGSQVRAICRDTVDLEINGVTNQLQNDAVIVCAGGILPTQFLKNIGIRMETKYGTA